jgi:hypothetical protein
VRLCEKGSILSTFTFGGVDRFRPVARGREFGAAKPVHLVCPPASNLVAVAGQFLVATKMRTCHPWGCQVIPATSSGRVTSRTGGALRPSPEVTALRIEISTISILRAKYLNAAKNY